MKHFIERTLERIAGNTLACFRVTFANGATRTFGAAEPQFSIRFNTRYAEWQTALFRHIGLLEAYFDGGVDIDGDLRAAFRCGMHSEFDTSNMLVRLRNRWHELWHGNRTRGAARRNARFHYGLGAPFYRQWLDDPYMMYTCAYWPEGVTSLEAAQKAKMEHVCRKIRLTPGDRVIDIGCGFGGFMFYAAERHRALVTGLNNAPEQVDEIAAQINHRHLATRVNVVESDFRNVFGEFDKVVSIGVLEHAGRDQLDSVIRAHADFLKPGGLGMLHFIGHVGRHETEFFIRKHVFPGGWIPSLAATIEAMERCGLEILDIENLRRHYALTLDEWAKRFDSRWPAIHHLDPARFDERFRRIWRTYLLGCAEMFRSPHGNTHLFQIVFSKGNVTRDSYPMSRRFLYAPQPWAHDDAASPMAPTSTIASRNTETV